MTTALALVALAFGLAILAVLAAMLGGRDDDPATRAASPGTWPAEPADECDGSAPLSVGDWRFEAGGPLPRRMDTGIAPVLWAQALDGDDRELPEMTALLRYQAGMSWALGQLQVIRSTLGLVPAGDEMWTDAYELAGVAT